MHSALREFRRHRFADIGGEGGNAALARKMIPEEGYLCDGRHRLVRRTETDPAQLSSGPHKSGQ